MSADIYPKFKAAVVQAAPVWLNRDATIEKVEALTTQAAREGAVLVVFSESYLPAFPVWNLIHRPPDQPAFFRRLYDNALRPIGPVRAIYNVKHLQPWNRAP
jgi:nitrilase